jgi:periplasmic protein TonB
MKAILITIAFIAACSTVRAQTTDTLKGLRADTLIFMRTEHDPEYVGGPKKLRKFLAANIKYPKTAGGIYGKVFVSFVVEKDGSLSDIKVVKSLTPETDAEAIRLMQSSPKWKPGIQNNRPVRVQYTMPIPFSLPSNN